MRLSGSVEESCVENNCSAVVAQRTIIGVEHDGEVHNPQW